MYTDPMHPIDDFDQGLEDCFEHAILEDRPIEDCFGNYGEEICVWDGHGTGTVSYTHLTLPTKRIV